MASSQLSYAQLMGLWDNAGGGSADIAAAIACAESARKPGAIQQDQPYATTGWGLWQITPGDSVRQVGEDYQLLDPFVNAQAAVHKWRQAGGFTPWTTYNDRAYLQFLRSGVSPTLDGVVNCEYEPAGKAPRGTHNT